MAKHSAGRMQHFKGWNYVVCRKADQKDHEAYRKALARLVATGREALEAIKQWTTKSGS